MQRASPRTVAPVSVRELVVLGTASQVPTRHRNHNGYFLRWDGEGLLFDPGEGTQRQMIHYGVTATSLTRILITHFHGDHCLGLASLVQRISLDEVPHRVAVHYPASGQVYYERLRRPSIFRDVARIDACPIREPGVIARSAELAIETLRLDHTVESWGYRVVEPDQWNVDADAVEARGVRGPAVGVLKRVGSVTAPDGRRVELAEVSTKRRGQKFAFVMDTRLCDAAFELARDTDLLVCESTYLDSEAAEARHNGHMTAREAARVAREAGARTLVLTHFSQRYRDIEPFVAEAREIHADVVAAVDGAVIALPPRGSST